MSGEACLYCGKDRHIPLTFAHMLAVSVQPGFCSACRGKLAPIAQTNGCIGCGRDLSRLDNAFYEHSLCHDCRNWRRKLSSYGRNYALYSYNDWMKELMTAFKFRSDSRIADGFSSEWRAIYHKIEGRSWQARWERLWYEKVWQDPEPHLLVPIPISPQRLQERGFNQAEYLADMLDGEQIPVLVRANNDRKQSKKSRLERLRMDNQPFQLAAAYCDRIKGRKLLIIDDIYTTGATIRKAAALLETAHPAKIDSLTLVHG
ncbi:MAG: phosphoribosyltransferase family protein [Sporolactobacillus sp.]